MMHRDATETEAYIQKLINDGYKEVSPHQSQLQVDRELKRAGGFAYNLIKCFKKWHDGILEEKITINYGINYRGAGYPPPHAHDIYSWYKLNTRKLGSLTKKLNEAGKLHDRTQREYFRKSRKSNRSLTGIEKQHNEFYAKLRKNRRIFSIDKYGSFLNAITVRGQDGTRGFLLTIPNNRKEAKIYFDFLKEYGFSGGRFRDDRGDNKEGHPEKIGEDTKRFHAVCKDALDLVSRSCEGAARVKLKDATGLDLYEIKTLLSDHLGSKYSTQPKMLARRIAYKINPMYDDEGKFKKERKFSPAYAKSKWRTARRR